jgi:hypothetical protein
MVWTKQDKNFLSLLHEFGIQSIDSEFQKANEWFSSASEKPDVTLFGEYSLKRQIFVWKNHMNEVSLNMIQDHYLTVFHSISTLPKLFTRSVILPRKWALTIPYLVKLINAAFHVVIMKKGDILLFYLVKIPIQDTIPFDVFQQLMSVYRLGQLEQRTHQKQHKQHKPKRRTKGKTKKTKKTKSHPTKRHSLQ